MCVSSDHGTEHTRYRHEKIGPLFIEIFGPPEQKCLKYMDPL